MSRDLEDVLREIGELSNIHADRKKLRANLREIRDHRLAYYNQSNEKELQAEFSDALFKILLLELDEEEEESIEIAELAYLGLGHIFRRPELPTPELYKRRLLLLHYFCDYFTDSIIEVFLSKYREDNILQARSLAIECLEKMQLSDMFYLEENATDFIDGDETVFEKKPLETCASLGQLDAYMHDGFWKPMDTLREKQQLEKMWADSTAPWKIW